MPDSHPDPAPAEPAAQTPDPAAKERHASLLGGMFAGMRQAGRDFVSVALGRLLETPADHEPPTTTDETGPPPTQTDAGNRRLGMLHGVAEQLRGAADSYVAAKLDEIEARVDAKLDRIEDRIDRKIVELHAQLAQMRDRELRHRLRLLKITLVFTVLVALLSLLYKWLTRFWQLG